VIVSRTVEPGQTVAASFQSPVLFIIAQDLKKMRVLADIDEADVGRLKETMSADVTVDAFPGETFQGKVTQVRYSAQVVSGVVTYAAVVDVDNPHLKLRPGMTATVTIRTAEAKGVTRIANAALRFKPSPKLDKDGKPVPEPPQPKLPPGKGRIHVIVDATLGQEKIEQRVVEIGITDGVNTVLKTELGDAKLVIDETDEGAKGANKRGPRFF
jgi:HlyD family secretion protein